MNQRPIKFRVWCPIPKIMLYDIDVEATGFVKRFNEETDDYDLIGPYYSVPVNEGNLQVNLMQFTGLYDKNGKEIWEGDVIEENNNANRYMKAIVKFGSFELEDGGFTGFYLDSTEFGISSLSTGDQEYIEVIGNVFENPELVGDGE